MLMCEHLIIDDYLQGNNENMTKSTRKRDKIKGRQKHATCDALGLSHFFPHESRKVGLYSIVEYNSILLLKT